MQVVLIVLDVVEGGGGDDNLVALQTPYKPGSGKVVIFLKTDPIQPIPVHSLEDSDQLPLPVHQPRLPDHGARHFIYDLDNHPHNRPLVIRYSDPSQL